MATYYFVLILWTIQAVNADYYWKDYSGTIPKDAYIGGQEADGTPTYIGLTYFPDKQFLSVTIIHKGERTAYFIVNKEKWESDKHTKILCSNNHTLFKWIPTDTKKIHYLTGCRLIYGGGNASVLLSIGRANHQGRTITGRVYDHEQHKGLYIHDGANHEMILKEFEVLTYDCKNPYVEEV